MASKYPGKQCFKKVADMTPYEYEQHIIYKKAFYRAHKGKYESTEAFKISRKAKDKRYAERHPDRVKFSNDRYRAAVRADPVKSAKQLQTNRELNARYRSEMSDCYIKSLISKYEGISTTIVSDEMIVARRATLTIERLIKTMN